MGYGHSYFQAICNHSGKFLRSWEILCTVASKNNYEARYVLGEQTSVFKLKEEFEKY